MVPILAILAPTKRRGDPDGRGGARMMFPNSGGFAGIHAPRGPADLALIWRRKLNGTGRHYGVAVIDPLGNVLEVLDLTSENQIRRLSLDEFLEDGLGLVNK